MIQYLSKPYPFKFLNLNEIRFYAILGLFVGLFLAVFQPFGISIWVTQYKFWKLAGYGLVSFIMPVALTLLRKITINERKAEYQYKVWHEIVWLILLVSSIAFGNLLYSNAIGISELSISAFLGFLGMVVPIAVFPILGSIGLKYQRYIELNKREAAAIEQDLIRNHDDITSTTKNLNFLAENEKDALDLPCHALLFIESMDNYSQFYYTENEKVVKLLLRGSLKHFELQISAENVVRCHRSFIVNLSNATHIEGNAQGYLLTMLSGDIKVPVSRNFGPKIKALFAK